MESSCSWTRKAVMNKGPPLNLPFPLSLCLSRKCSSINNMVWGQASRAVILLLAVTWTEQGIVLDRQAPMLFYFISLVTLGSVDSVDLARPHSRLVSHPFFLLSTKYLVHRLEEFHFGFGSVRFVRNFGFLFPNPKKPKKKNQKRERKRKRERDKATQRDDGFWDSRLQDGRICSRNRYVRPILYKASSHRQKDTPLVYY